jgi:hypothetical protein
MESKLRILIAEDTKQARDIIFDELTDFLLNKGLNEENFEIVKASSFQKANKILNDSEKEQNYFNIFFADIDFTEDGK